MRGIAYRANHVSRRHGSANASVIRELHVILETRQQRPAQDVRQVEYFLF
jgi:hypothetical protein